MASILGIKSYNHILPLTTEAEGAALKSYAVSTTLLNPADTLGHKALR